MEISVRNDNYCTPPACVPQGAPLENLHTQLSFVTPRVESQNASSKARVLPSAVNRTTWVLSSKTKLTANLPTGSRAEGPDRLVNFSDVDGGYEARGSLG